AAGGEGAPQRPPQRPFARSRDRAPAGGRPHRGPATRGNRRAVGGTGRAARLAGECGAARGAAAAGPPRRGRDRLDGAPAGARRADHGGGFANARPRRRGAAAGGRPGHRRRPDRDEHRRRGRAVSRPVLADLEAARERLRGVARVTPVLSSNTLGGLTGRPVSLKAENLQLTGSFKIRGAYNTIAQLTSADRERGVVTASAGNHGQAVA